MPNTSKTFRLFLSSTFNDMRAERDALQERVFPRLRAYCDKYGFSFSPIDLRWGVSSEAGDDQKTMQICIDEVKRCKNALNPHFAIMLGERYGWIPLPAKVEASEFELVKDAVLLKFKDDEKVKEYIELWYKKDTNALPAEYLLQAKIKDEHKDWEYWGDVESTLRGAFKSVVEDELSNLLDDEIKAKYIKSATEQEIVEGLFHNKEVAQKNIYYYSRNFTNIDSMSEDEFATLESKDKEYRKTHPEYQITIKHFSDFKDFTQNRLDDEIRPFHQKLQDKIRESIPKENYKEYNLQLDTNLEKTQDSVTQKHLEEFCEDFYNTIFSSMKNEIESFQAQDIQTRELQEQQSFMEEKSKIFVGREDFLTKVNTYIESDESNTPLVIYADSGSGKSALMAKLISNVDNMLDDKDIFYRFVGTSELSNTPLNLYKSLYLQLTEYFKLLQITNDYIAENQLTQEIVLGDIKELNKVLSNLIQNYPQDKKLVLFIDALDQFILKDSLDWLPRVLNNNIKIIISTLPDTYEGIEYLPKLKQKFKDSQESFIFLESFKDDEADSMVDEYLHSYRRTLTPLQKEKILNAFMQSGSPLYLKIILEEASEWKSYTDIKSEKYPQELDTLITRLFTRLHTNSHHSLAVIKYAFSYIACSKDGLEEPELFDILSQEKEIMDDVSNEFYPRPQRVPTAIWARLYSEMSHYLSVKEIDGMDQISFFHRKFNEGAYKLFDSKQEVHNSLAKFYTLVYEQDSEVLKEKKIGASLESSLSELPYQLIMSKQKKQVLALLTNFDFIMEKLKLNKLSELLEDYTFAKAEGINAEDNERFNIFDNFLTSNKHIIEKGDEEWQSHKIFFQLSIEHADDSPLSIDADKFESENKVDWDYFKATARTPKMYLSPVVKHLDLGVGDKVTFSNILADKKILYCFEKTNDILVYDSKTDEKLFLQAHQHPPMGVIEIDNMLISYEVQHNYTTTIIFWVDYIAKHKSTIYRDLQKVIKLNNRIILEYKDGVEIIPLDKLKLLEKNMEII